LLVKTRALPGSLPVFTLVDYGKVKHSVTIDNAILAEAKLCATVEVTMGFLFTGAEGMDSSSSPTNSLPDG